jgi:aryl-alcohol dehydrogenase
VLNEARPALGARADRWRTGRRDFSLDHLATLWGKRVMGVLGGGGRSGQLISALVELHRQGRFPFDRLVQYYEMDDIERALADSKAGRVIKAVLRMSDA